MLVVRACEQRREPGGQTGERAGLVSAHLEVLLLRHGVRVRQSLVPGKIHPLPEADVDELLYADLVGVDDRPVVQPVAVLHQCQERQEVEDVGRVHRDVYAVCRVQCREPASQRRAVFYVVCYYRAVVQELHEYRVVDVFFRVLSESLDDQQEQRGTPALAAALHELPRWFGDSRVHALGVIRVA